MIERKFSTNPCCWRFSASRAKLQRSRQRASGVAAERRDQRRGVADRRDALLERLGQLGQRRLCRGDERTEVVRGLVQRRDGAVDLLQQRGPVDGDGVELSAARARRPRAGPAAARSSARADLGAPRSALLSEDGLVEEALDVRGVRGALAGDRVGRVDDRCQLAALPVEDRDRLARQRERRVGSPEDVVEVIARARRSRSRARRRSPGSAPGSAG